ncbi:MAG: glucosyltransferase domain-containing protein [Faecalibacterium sp.]|jgi:hypothetical protein|nr:glucosyltransferase domain-containing protein [Faecalibacterium sp.]
MEQTRCGKWFLRFMQSKEDAPRRANLLAAYAGTVLFAFAAHAFAFFNYYPTHDATKVVIDDQLFQCSLGRFLQPVYTAVRGIIVSPWPIALLFMLFLGGAVYLIAELLGIRQNWITFILGGLLASNITTVCAFAAYLNWADMYMLALLLACAGVWCAERLPLKTGLPAAALCFMALLALYQCYIAAAVGLYLLLILKKALDGGHTPAALFFTGVKYVASLLLGGGLYYLVMKLVLLALGLSLADRENGLAKLGYTGLGEFLKMIPAAYSQFFSFFLKKQSYISIPAWGAHVVLFLLAVGAFGWLLWARRKKPADMCFALLAFLLLPLGLNIIQVMSDGYLHTLMIYAFFLSYAAVLILVGRASRERAAEKRPHAKLPLLLCGVLCAVLLYENVLYANGAYTYKKLTYDSTLSAMTRIMDHVESDPAYVPGETEVAFIGEFSDSALGSDRPGFVQYKGATGVYCGGSALTYPKTVIDYSTYILGDPICTITDSARISALAAQSDIAGMPCYPAAGFCEMKDGVMIVKLAQTEG